MNSFCLTFEWKTFTVDLASVEFWLRNSAVGSYSGSSADSNYRLWFSAEPTENQKMTVQQHWDSLSEEGENAKIALRVKRDTAIAYATSNLPYLSMNMWSPAEIKIFMNQPLADADKDALVAKYPNI